MFLFNSKSLPVLWRQTQDSSIHSPVATSPADACHGEQCSESGSQGQHTAVEGHGARISVVGSQKVIRLLLVSSSVKWH